MHTSQSIPSRPPAVVPIVENSEQNVIKLYGHFFRTQNGAKKSAEAKRPKSCRNAAFSSAGCQWLYLFLKLLAVANILTYFYIGISIITEFCASVTINPWP